MLLARRRYNERMPSGHQGDDVRPASSGVKFTYEDFLNFLDDGNRHEIIDGEHYVTPSPNTKHQAVSISLAAIVWTYLKRHPIGAVFAAPFDVVFSDLSVVEPDLLYISRERGGSLTDKHVRGAPNLVVEILSPRVRAKQTRSRSASCTSVSTSGNTGWSIQNWMQSRCTVERAIGSIVLSSSRAREAMHLPLLSFQG